MATVPQYYGGTGLPVVVDADRGDPARAWRSQRARLRAWVDGLDDDGWQAPTRCPAWDARGLVQHLASGAAFLGYTLHKGLGGTATRKLEVFDTHETVEATTALLDGLTLDELRAALAEADANIDRQIPLLEAVDWQVTAEAPPGHMGAHLSISHFLFDSWVHEFDLLLPVGQAPSANAFEAEVAARYLLGVATANLGLDTSLEVRMTDIDVRLLFQGDGSVMRVHPDGSDAVAGPGTPVVEGTALAIMDRATGRPTWPGTSDVAGDPAGLKILDTFGSLLN